MSSFQKYWFTNLPEVHFKVSPGSSFKIYLYRYLVHPIKRRVAKYYLCFLRRFFDLKVIGITGSAGKTTTKEMLTAVLSQVAPTVSSWANIDPVYNIPTTILKCKPSTKYLVLEMGVEYPQEMDYYLWLAKPDIALVLNIYPTHTLFLKDLKGVLKEKGKIVSNLSSSQIAILNADDLLLRGLAKKVRAKLFWFSEGEDPILTNQNAARKVCEVLKIQPSKIENGLQSYQKPENRLEKITLKCGTFIFNDAYNSNPQAFLAALKMFAKLSAKKIRIGVFGDMLELGDLEQEKHRLIGKEIAKFNFATVIGVGEAIRYTLEEIQKRSPQTKVLRLKNYLDVISLLKNFLKKNVAIFVKGSHSTRLYELVSKLKDSV